MEGFIIWIISIWGCAALFLGIGIYAGKREKPMWFWSGTTVEPDTISDIPAYNKAYRKMWIIYSIPFWVTGISYLWYPMQSAILMVVSSTLGVGWLIWYYHGIEKKYKIK